MSQNLQKECLKEESIKEIFGESQNFLCEKDKSVKKLIAVWYDWSNHIFVLCYAILSFYRVLFFCFRQMKGFVLHTMFWLWVSRQTKGGHLVINQVLQSKKVSKCLEIIAKKKWMRIRIWRNLNASIVKLDLMKKNNFKNMFFLVKERSKMRLSKNSTVRFVIFNQSQMTA